MSNGRNIPTIQSSELRDLRVLFLHPDATLCESIEASAEQKLPRVNFYSASSLSSGRDILKRYSCQLAIFVDGIEGKDFVFTQLELRNALPSVRMIPLIDVPTIEQLSAQRRIGGIHSFGSKRDATSFESISTLVLNFARDLAKAHPGIDEHFDFGNTLQSFLFARNPSERSQKKVSAKILDGLLLRYDWNPQEALQIATAEMIFAPELPAPNYADLLGNDKYQLGGWLSQTASWCIAGTKPTGPAGLVITLANFGAWQLAQGNSVVDILSAAFARPHFLLHPAIRAVNREELGTLLETIKTNEGSQPSKSVRNAG